MDFGEECPICYSEYTNTGGHRIVVLKCGHLFGLQCIEVMFGRKKTILCPLCFKPSRKTDIRSVFASKIVAYDSEKEDSILKDLFEEKKIKAELQEENSRLSSNLYYIQCEMQRLEKEINLLKNSSNENKSEEYRLKRKFKRIKINFKTERSILLCDDFNSYLFITFYSNEGIGIKKYDLENLLIKDVYNLFGCCDEYYFCISDIKVSPYKDGIVACSYKNSIKVINSITGHIINIFSVQSRVYSLCFDSKDRNILYSGDERGFVTVYDLTKGLVQEIMVNTKSLHSIYKSGNIIYCGSINGIFLVTFDEKLTTLFTIKKYDESFYQGICTNLYGINDLILCTFRMNSINSTHKIIGIENFNLSNDITQYRRIRDKLYKNYVIYLDEKYNKVIIYDYLSEMVVDSFKFNERIIDFNVSDEKIFILTENSLFLFKE
ncbi:hypothetical protein CWI37_1775p0010 [Hamiltosporidium tvaerminnensis]|uniref:RING-type domain-containing protein n=1 Tax=Hamiltosporidium tvaerminnensis TaxID=1176355 RepID=A0A4Q9KUZ7_9MICR|nr:hypothetical protein CWI37_1775p0010 [Hamiltosporidium tvaerminnensis]